MKLDKKEKNRLAQAKFRKKNPELCRKYRREWKEREKEKMALLKQELETLRGNKDIVK